MYAGGSHRRRERQGAAEVTDLQNTLRRMSERFRQAGHRLDAAQVAGDDRLVAQLRVEWEETRAALQRELTAEYHQAALRGDGAGVEVIERFLEVVTKPPPPAS